MSTFKCKCECVNINIILNIINTIRFLFLLLSNKNIRKKNVKIMFSKLRSKVSIYHYNMQIIMDYFT